MNRAPMISQRVVINGLVFLLSKPEFYWVQQAQWATMSQREADTFISTAHTKKSAIRRKAVCRALKIRISPEIAQPIPRYCHPA